MDDNAVHLGCSRARQGQERSVWRLFDGFPYVVVRHIRLIEQEQWVLEVIEYVLFRFAVSYVLQEVQVSLISTLELMIKGLDLADFMQTALLQD